MEEKFSLVLHEYLSGKEPQGGTLDEVKRLELKYNVQFPSDYREFLLQVGWGAEGLWRGSDYEIGGLPDLQEAAVELLSDSGLELPEGAFVFLMHQGYQFFYLASDGVYYFFEGKKEVEKKAESFAQFFEKVVKL